MAENNEIPENADKLLFAQDLMKHVMKYTVEATYTGMTVEIYRDFVCTAYNETITEAVSFLFNDIDMEIKNTISTMLNEQSLNLAGYTEYEKDLKKYFIDGFDTSVFLFYCVPLASLAMQFYNHGVVEAPNLAVAYIASALDDVDMTTGGWDTLNSVGGIFASIENDTVNHLSPQSSFGEEDSSSNCEQRMDESSPSHAILIQVGSISLSNEDFKEHEVQIQKVLVEDFHQHSDSSSSPESREDSKKLKKFRSTSSGNSSNFGEHAAVSKSSAPETLAAGTSNTTGLSVRSMQCDYLDTALKEENHVQTLTSEKESDMLGETSKSERSNSDSDDILDSDDISGFDKFLDKYFPLCQDFT